MSEYSEITDKIDLFDLFIDFLKEKYPGIKDEFFEWREKHESTKANKKVQG